MIRTIKILTLVLFLLTILSPFVNKIKGTEPTAIGEDPFSINAAFTYGFNMEEPGIRIGAGYLFGENSRVVAGFTYWFLDDFEHETRLDTIVYSETGLEANINYNYIFYNSNNAVIYAIGVAGLHYQEAKPQNGNNERELTEPRFAYGYGVGLEYNMGTVSLFADIKNFRSGWGQTKTNFGARIYF